MNRKFQFTIGGAAWEAQIVRGDLGKRYELIVEQNLIQVSSHYRKRKLREHIPVLRIWDGIYAAIHHKVMMKSGGIWSKFENAYTHAVATTFSRVGDGLPLEGHDIEVEILGNTYLVTVDNEVCDREEIYGKCDANSQTITLQLESDERGRYHPQFVRQTLFHEIIHAINYELGLAKTPWDTESQVNSLAYLLAEAWHTFREVKTTDNATDSENTKTEQE